MTKMECANCIMHFGIDSELAKRCQETGRTFYCPNGHANVYKETEIDRLKKENKRLKDDVHWTGKILRDTQEDLQITKREKATIKGQLTKTRKRIANGVCPCCHRTFVNVQRHMTTKHPDFKEVVG